MMNPRGATPANVRANKPSLLLSSEENKAIFSLLKKKSQSIYTAVVQLFMTEAPHSKWIYYFTGVLCFVKDNAKRSFYCRLFCLDKLELLWEHEIYSEIEITRPLPFFITFEGQTGVVGFNFTSEDEAESFWHIATLTIRSRNRRREESLKTVFKRELPAIPDQQEISYQPVPLRNAPKVSNQAPSPPPTATIPLHKIHREGKKTKTSKKYKKQPEVKKICKVDIGVPMHFKHITHLGFESEKGFELIGQDKNLMPFLEKVGVSESQLEDRQTREFIYDFLETNRVSEAVKIERALPPIPSSEQTMRPSRKLPNLPTSNIIPVRQGSLPGAPKQKRSGPTRQPPPVNTTSRTSNVKNREAPSLPPTSLGAGPPPPPMMMPPAAPVMISAGNQDLGLPNLKKVETNTNNSSNDLLMQIQKGFKLKSAAEREDNASPAAISGGSCRTDALAQALRDALASRGNAIRPASSDSEESGSNNDEDWD